MNLERPLAAGARLGGHFVQGHVDGTGRVTELVPEGDSWWLSVGAPGIAAVRSRKRFDCHRRHQLNCRVLEGMVSQVSR